MAIHDPKREASGETEPADVVLCDFQPPELTLAGLKAPTAPSQLLFCAGDRIPPFGLGSSRFVSVASLVEPLNLSFWREAVLASIFHHWAHSFWRHSLSFYYSVSQSVFCGTSTYCVLNTVPPLEDDHGNSNSSHVKIFLPKKLLECLPKCSSLPKERHRWNTNERS
ncbi:uncharacterized protein LOC115944808 [Leptonychotes weddellii]|uniref:Uncharacterized protein LOC115944808 n=1 Tax=Leptonychotes weddellii TaxID=9713 RepID=A0A7F8RVE3_LEPWE|nr:uncharacterized protein LOC115944808 [Leptonychotes weddellii]